MNDPHVVALLYLVEHSPDFDYDKADPLEHDTSTFRLRVENDQARFELKQHYATEREARAAVEPFVRAWELDAGLHGGPDKFALKFDSAEVVDRAPPPGNVGSLRGSCTIHLNAYGNLHLSCSRYPEPPPNLSVSPEVDRMYSRYTLYRRRGELLGNMASFCLTELEESAGSKKQLRRKAAKKYGVSLPVLNKLGVLTTKKGGVEARKASGVHEEYTVLERLWIEATVKAMIRRAAEVAYDPGQALQQITFADLPPLDKPDEGRS